MLPKISWAALFDDRFESFVRFEPSICRNPNQRRWPGTRDSLYRAMAHATHRLTSRVHFLSRRAAWLPPVFSPAPQSHSASAWCRSSSAAVRRRCHSGLCGETKSRDEIDVDDVADHIGHIRKITGIDHSSSDFYDIAADSMAIALEDFTRGPYFVLRSSCAADIQITIFKNSLDAITCAPCAAWRR
jgi:hypothetical protein